MQNAGMPVNITIRDVPNSVRDELAARAAREGKSMQEYLRGELERLAAIPSLSDWLAGVKESKEASGVRLTAAQILRARAADRK
jgi:hypothetical protein